MEGFFGGSLDEHLLQFLRRFFGHEDLSRYNVEDVLSYLDLSRARIPKWTGPAAMVGHWVPDYDLLLDYVVDRLTTYGPPCALHQQLVEGLDPKDTILTLNYDLICDQALQELERHISTSGGRARRLQKLSALLGMGTHFDGEPFTLMPREQESGFYIKLHGSIDWLYCPNFRCENASRYHIDSGRAGGGPCRRCGTLLKTFIVPPVATKVIEHEGKLAFLWNLALRAFANAGRIVVIGVSFAPSDYELRWLLRQGTALCGFPVNLDLVNPIEYHRKVVLSLVPRRGEVRHFATLVDYLEGRQVES
jgi:hypothetical protein